MQGAGSRVYGLGRVSDIRVTVSGFEFRVLGRVSGFGFRVESLRLKGLGCRGAWSASSCSSISFAATRECSV